eukprot:scaffold2803_cov347-Prasinococcus_capsulatus_cf.AAC.3
MQGMLGSDEKKMLRETMMVVRVPDVGAAARPSWRGGTHDEDGETLVVVYAARRTRRPLAPPPSRRG